MKLFIIGMPESGRTTVSKALCQSTHFVYVDATSWLKNSFRTPNPNEHPEQYHDAYHYWHLNRVKENRNLIINHIQSTMDAYQSNHDWVIDGINSPHDFSALFDPNKDFVVFLNRNDNQDVKVKDYETIGISVIRDYCFWLASGGLLVREKWHEYNFRIVGATDRFKAMGSKNSVFLIGSIDKIVNHLKDTLITDPHHPIQE